MTGTVLNIIAVLIGGSIGTLLGSRLPAKVLETAMHGLGLMGVAIGVVMASGTENFLIPLFSVVVGGILGELLRIDDGLNWLGAQAEARWGGHLGQNRVAGWSVTRALCHLQPDFLRWTDDHPSAAYRMGCSATMSCWRSRALWTGLPPSPSPPAWGRAFCSVSARWRWYRAGCPRWQWESAAGLETSAGRRRGLSN